MKELIAILFISTSLFAELMNHNKTIGGYDLHIYTKKSLVIGVAKLYATITKDGKDVNLQTKMKVFMPQMPGMPYMDNKSKGEKIDSIYNFKVNFSMNGTWQYILKFRDENKKVYKVKGSINL